MDSVDNNPGTVNHSISPVDKPVHIVDINSDALNKK